MKSGFFKIIGWVCLVVAFFGLVLPLFQSVFLVVLGLYLLSKTSPKFKEGVLDFLNKAKDKFPKQSAWLEKVRVFTEKHF